VVVSVEFVGYGEVAGLDAIAGCVHGLVEFEAGDVVGFWDGFAGQEFFDNGDRAGNSGGSNGSGGGCG